MITRELTAQRLRELLHYDPESGVFTWLVQQNGRAPAGSRAGSFTCAGYVAIKIDRVSHLAHRLAWLWVYGAHPGDLLDHINRVRDDNRIANLREATVYLNAQNQGVRATSRSGVAGVVPHRSTGKWVAYIQRNSRRRHLGVFDLVEDAIAARRLAEARSAA